MEQVYNYTQDDPSYHDIGIKNYAAQIQTKAAELNGTAESKSTEELTNTRAVDIQGTNKKGDQLPTKANLLKGKAEELYTAAESLRSEAAKVPESPLKDLSGPARQLKDAAKGSGNTDLYNAANELATHTGGTGLENKATQVITAFDTVKTAYNALMKTAGGLTSLTPEQQQKVAAVETEYGKLKSVYDGMLNLTKLHKAANALKDAASTLPTLSGAAEQLETNVKDLRDQGADAQKVKSQYETVRNKFYALGAQANSVQNQFDALNTVYDHIGSITLPDLLIPNLTNNS